jgi:hypothetical protein
VQSVFGCTSWPLLCVCLCAYCTAQSLDPCNRHILSIRQTLWRLLKMHGAKVKIINWDWFNVCWRWLWNTGQEVWGGWRKNSVMVRFIISAVQQILLQWSIVFLHLLIRRACASLDALRSYSSQIISFVSLAVHRVCAFLRICVLFVRCPTVQCVHV